MKLKLKAIPKSATIIEGFPGHGLVATIAVGHLIDALGCEKIGSWYFEESPATIAVHSGKLLEPVSFHWAKKENLLLIYSLTSAIGIEWKAAELITSLCDQVQAKELISVEGVAAPGAEAKELPKVYHFSADPNVVRKMRALGIPSLNEGIIVGVTAALLQLHPQHLTCLFAEARPAPPDSRAAAAIVRALDKYLGLKIEYEPLIKQAEAVEARLKTILEEILKIKEKAAKRPAYIV